MQLQSVENPTNSGCGPVQAFESCCPGKPASPDLRDKIVLAILFPPFWGESFCRDEVGSEETVEGWVDSSGWGHGVHSSVEEFQSCVPVSGDDCWPGPPG